MGEQAGSLGNIPRRESDNMTPPTTPPGHKILPPPPPLAPPLGKLLDTAKDHFPPPPDASAPLSGGPDDVILHLHGPLPSTGSPKRVSEVAQSTLSPPPSPASQFSMAPLLESPPPISLSPPQQDLEAVRPQNLRSQPQAVSRPPPRLQNKEEIWSELQACSGPQAGNQLYEEVIFLKDNEVRNRPNVKTKCPKATAVTINGQNIHANRVSFEESGSERVFISSQYPPVENQALFWQCAFDEGGDILDLMSAEDMIREGDSIRYYPTKIEEPFKYANGRQTVTYISAESSPPEGPKGLMICPYKVTCVDSKGNPQEKIIKRFQYPRWKDFSATSEAGLTGLVDLLENTKELKIIHCRAGVGRTGTLISAYFLNRGIQSGEVTRENLHSYLFDMIYQLRKQRGPSFVQQEEQLDLLLRYGNQQLGEIEKARKSSLLAASQAESPQPALQAESPHPTPPVEPLQSQAQPTQDENEMLTASLPASDKKPISDISENISHISDMSQFQSQFSEMDTEDIDGLEFYKYNLSSKDSYDFFKKQEPMMQKFLNIFEENKKLKPDTYRSMTKQCAVNDLCNSIQKAIKLYENTQGT